MVVKREEGLRELKLGNFFFLDSERQHGVIVKSKRFCLVDVCVCVCSTRHEPLSQICNLMVDLGQIV